MTIEQQAAEIMAAPSIAGSNKYDPLKVYALYVNPSNRHIAAIVGFASPIESLNDGNNFLHVNVADLKEDEYNIISKSINSTECMTFLGDNNRTIIVRRLFIDLLENTFFDANINMIYGLDNIIKLGVRCVDNTLTEVDDVKSIQIKNIKKNYNPISLNDNSPDILKVHLDNPGTVKCELLGDNVHTIKIKATLPTVSYLWLTAYPQMIKLTAEHQANLKAWLATQPAATTATPTV